MSSPAGRGQTVLVAEAIAVALPESGAPPPEGRAAWLGLSRWPRVPSLTVGGVMRAGPPPAAPDDRLAVVAARMRSTRAGAVAVVEGGRLVGMISEHDLLRAVADGLSTDMTPVAAYMGPVACVIGQGAQASDAAQRMIELRARHLPVVRDGEVVGVISASDLLVAGGVPRELLEDEPRAQRAGTHW